MRAERALLKVSRDEMKRAQALSRETGLMDYNTGLGMAHDRGRAEGLVIGQAKGRVEEKREAARKLKGPGDTVEKIVLVTGLPREEVERL